MDWSQSGRAEELARGLSDAAVWLLACLRGTDKKGAGRFNAKRLARQSFIHKTLACVDTNLDSVLSELAAKGFVEHLGGTRYRKRSSANLVEHLFRRAIAEGTLRGEIPRNAAELPDAVRSAREILWRKGLEHAR